MSSSPSAPSSPESAASTSVSSERVCELCGNASRTSSAGGSSPSTGLAFPAIPTCAPLWPTPTVNGNHNRKRNQNRDGTKAESGDGLSTAVTNPSVCPCECHKSMFSAEVSPARASVSQDWELGLRIRARVFGPILPDLYANFDPSTSSWRTFRHSGKGASKACLLTSWRAGMTRSGTAYQLEPLAPRTSATGSGLLPTPSAVSYGNNRGGAVGPVRHSLQSMASRNEWPTPHGMAKRGAKRKPGPSGNELGRAVNEAERFPTPTVSDHKGAGPLDRRPPGDDNLSTRIARQEGGPLNPEFVEWLMGFPIGWTDLKRSATPSSPQSPSSSANAS
jgi:hypothetical protein